MAILRAYTEDQLVEQPAIGLFAALGWQTVSAMDETFGANGTLGRETKGEVVLVDRLRAALGAIEHRGGHGPFSVSVTLGAAPLDPEVPVEVSIDRARAALDAAKEAGRNRLASWEPERASNAA